MPSDKTEPVTAQRAYEAATALLLQRARRAIAERDDDLLVLFVGAADRWFRATPWAELSEHDREFWDVIAGLLNTSGLKLEAIGTVLEVVRRDAEARKGEGQAREQ